MAASDKSCPKDGGQGLSSGIRLADRRRAHLSRARQAADGHSHLRHADLPQHPPIQDVIDKPGLNGNGGPSVSASGPLSSNIGQMSQPFGTPSA